MKMTEYKQQIEYMVIMKRLDGTTAKRTYFTNKVKADRYAKALEKKYPHLTIKILEV